MRGLGRGRTEQVRKKMKEEEIIGFLDVRDTTLGGKEEEEENVAPSMLLLLLLL